MSAKAKKKETKQKSKKDKMEVEETVDIAETEKEPEIDLVKMMKDNVTTLLRAVELDDKNLIRRVWGRNTVLRKNLSLYQFQHILTQNFPSGSLLKNLLTFLDTAIAVHEKLNANIEAKDDKMEQENAKEVTEEPLLEVEAYLTLFIVSTLIKYEVYDEALNLCQNLLQRFQVVNRQTLDSFLSKTYSYYALASEKMKYQHAHYDELLLTDLITGQKTSALRLYEQSQATIINLILRWYISDKLYDKARMFLETVDVGLVLGSSNVGNSTQVRYLYYSGKVCAVEANYSESYKLVTRAIRKCPTNTGLGFRLTCNKLNIVTRLLMGEVPERSLFYDTDMRKELEPYFYLVKSVRNGSVAEFDKVTQSFAEKFERDDLMTLINRLRSSVVKTALRNINLAYSQISFKDIKAKLELRSERDAELVCAKAIRDAIIENAIIDSKSKSLISTETVDVYSTSLEPKEQFYQRTKFCLDLHNSAMKAHKYPPNSHKPTDVKKEEAKDEDSDDEF